MATVVLTQAQNSNKTVHYTKADTLRGSITAERAWWDVQYYAVHVTPDIVPNVVPDTDRQYRYPISLVILILSMILTHDTVVH